MCVPMLPGHDERAGIGGRGRLLGMWVYLENWLVQDGEIPELAAGMRLRSAGLRAYCVSGRPADDGRR